MTCRPCFLALPAVALLLASCTTEASSPPSAAATPPATTPASALATPTETPSPSFAPSPDGSPRTSDVAGTRRVALAGVSLVVPASWTTVLGPCSPAVEPGSVVVEGVSNAFVDCVTPQTDAPSVTVDSARATRPRSATRRVGAVDVHLSRLSCSTFRGRVTCRRAVTAGGERISASVMPRAGALEVTMHGEPGQQASVRRDVRALVDSVAALAPGETAVPVVDGFGGGSRSADLQALASQVLGQAGLRLGSFEREPGRARFGPLATDPPAGSVVPEGSAVDVLVPTSDRRR